jgi:hypothetical protein
LKYIFGLICFILILGASIQGVFSSNPYTAHDSLFFLIYLGAAIVSGWITMAGEGSADPAVQILAHLTTLPCIAFTVLAFVYMMYDLASGPYCEEHLHNIARCH